MPAFEMYDFLGTDTPDYAGTLNVIPQEILIEEGIKNQEVHHFDDGSERRISHDDTSVFHVRMRWGAITTANAGNIISLFHDAAKANGIINTFPWDHPAEAHSYVIRFDSKLPRTFVAGRPTHHTITEVRFKVTGRIDD